MSDPKIESRELAARTFEEAVDALNTAITHLRVAAADYRAGTIDHACARAWAAQGELAAATQLMSDNARLHAFKVREHLGQAAT